VNSLNKYHIARANWDYKDDFALFIEKGSLDPDWELIKILMKD
jgi:hypothetical protein